MPNEARIDVRGLNCSDAVVRLHKTISPLSPGSLVRVLLNDEDVIGDLKKYAVRGGHEWLGTRTEGANIEAEVRRGD